MKKRGKSGFRQAAGILSETISKAGEKRGFAKARLFTHWAEIVGQDLANLTRPLKVNYSGKSFGATLTILTSGAVAQEVRMQLPVIKDRVNACYGYAAISQIRITQVSTLDTDAPPEKPTPQAERKSNPKGLSKGVEDDGLRAALEALECNITNKPTV
jgi:hypothetical protein